MRAALVAGAIAMLLAARAYGFGGGVSGRSGAPGAGSCSDCHSGAAAPTVAIVGPTEMSAGTSASFRLDITTGASTRGGSWDVAVVGDGVLGAVSGTPAAQILNGELTHTSTHASGATVSVSFTLRAGAPGQLTLYANGLSSDGSGTGGDGTGAAQQAITVGPPPDLAGLDLAGLDLAEPPDLADPPADLATAPKPPPKDEARWACACDVGRSRAPSADGGTIALACAAAALLLARARRRCMVAPCAAHSSSAPPASSAATSSSSSSPTRPTTASPSSSVAASAAPTRSCAR